MSKDKTKPFDAGTQAAKAGKPRTSNPHPAGSRANMAWNLGYSWGAKSAA